MSDEPRFHVTLMDGKYRDRFGHGHPQFEVPIQGGQIAADGIRVEIRLVGEWKEGDWRWRDYKTLERLVAKAEKQGGWGWVGRDITVGDDILSGKDVIEFLSIAVRRANQRARDGGQYAQGYNDALSEIRTMITGAVNAIPEKYELDAP